MEIIPISESKLKIMLTPDDMAEYAISEEALSYEKKDVRTLFSGILDEVKSKTGFDGSIGRLFIQVYPSKGGGCEVYLTRNSDEAKKYGQKDRKQPPKTQKEYCVYAFASLADAISACCILCKCGYSYESKLCERPAPECGYFLVLQEDVLRDNRYKKKRFPNKSDLAAEFGQRMGGKEALLYVSERSKVIIDNDAVRVAGSLG